MTRVFRNVRNCRIFVTKLNQTPFLILGNTCEPRGVLVGSNQAINSVEFDSTGTLILGTSNDYASRVWSISDHRLRVSSFYELFCVPCQISIDNLEDLFWTKMGAKSKGKS